MGKEIASKLYYRFILSFVQSIKIKTNKSLTLTQRELFSVFLLLTILRTQSYETRKLDSIDTFMNKL